MRRYSLRVACVHRFITLAVATVVHRDTRSRVTRLLVILTLFALQSLRGDVPGPLVVHVIVALCDNKHQGIVPVPPAIGNGQDPRNNLYWGADFGVKSWLFRRDKWTRIEVREQPKFPILERLVARKVIGGRVVYIVADAWDGAEIKQATNQFLEAAAGLRPESYKASDGAVLAIGSGADIVAYVGHDGLMDFATSAGLTGGAGRRPRSIVLACASRQYFEPLLRRGGSEPLLLTTNLMAPEAYTLTAAIAAHVTGADVREAAAQAYKAHQSCSIKGARALFFAP